MPFVYRAGDFGIEGIDGLADSSPVVLTACPAIIYQVHGGTDGGVRRSFRFGGLFLCGWKVVYLHHDQGDTSTLWDRCYSEMRAAERLQDIAQIAKNYHS
jgi:hypothetical protein